MRKACTLIILILMACSVYAQQPTDTTNKAITADTTKTANKNYDVEAQYPGGVSAFFNFIIKQVEQTKLPELVSIFGFRGRIVVAFNVTPTGKVVDVQTIGNSGFGIEEQVVAAVKTSPQWKPAMKNGQPVQEGFTIPFSFNIKRVAVNFNDLRDSSFDYVFDIDGQKYTLDQAEALLGKSFSMTRFITVLPYKGEYNKSKKGVYLVRLRG